MREGVLATIGRFCMYLNPHPHSKPIILFSLFITRHFREAHWMLCLWIFHNILASLLVIGA
jgi:hypothetical protein